MDEQILELLKEGYKISFLPYGDDTFRIIVTLNGNGKGQSESFPLHAVNLHDAMSEAYGDTPEILRF